GDLALSPAGSRRDRGLRLPDRARRPADAFRDALGRLGGSMSVRRLFFGLSLALAVAPRLLAQVGFPLFSTDFPPEEFAKRRAAVYEAIGGNAVAILQGAPTPVGYTRFRQSNHF